jgi:hypothetical protein
MKPLHLTKHHSIPSVLDGDEWSFNASIALSRSKHPPQTYRVDNKWVDLVASVEAEYAVYRCESYAYRVRGLLILLLHLLAVP